jgi:hypothetical protein
MITSALDALLPGEPPRNSVIGARNGNLTGLGSAQDAGHAGPRGASSAESFLARSLCLDLSQVTEAALEASFELYRRGAR